MGHLAGSQGPGHFTFLGSRCFLSEVYKEAAMHGLLILGLGYSTRLSMLSGTAACLFI